MELVTVPLSIFKHADLRKPLCDKIAVSVNTRSVNRAGDSGRKIDTEEDRLSRLYGLGNSHCHDGLVVKIIIVGVTKFLCVSQVVFTRAFLFDQLDRVDANVSPIVFGVRPVDLSSSL